MTLYEPGLRTQFAEGGRSLPKQAHGQGLSNWEYRARFKLEDLRSPRRFETRATKRSVHALESAFEECYAHKPAASVDGALRWRIEFDVKGALANTIVLNAGTLDVAEQGCIDTVLRNAVWKGLPHGETSLELRFELRMTVVKH